MINTADSFRLAGEFLALLADKDDQGMAGMKLVLDEMDREDTYTFRTALILLAGRAVGELAELRGESPNNTVERLKP